MNLVKEDFVPPEALSFLLIWLLMTPLIDNQRADTRVSWAGPSLGEFPCACSKIIMHGYIIFSPKLLLNCIFFLKCHVHKWYRTQYAIVYDLHNPTEEFDETDEFEKSQE